MPNPCFPKEFETRPELTLPQEQGSLVGNTNYNNGKSNNNSPCIIISTNKEEARVRHFCGATTSGSFEPHPSHSLP